jgi:hypothetical protein
MMRWWLLACPLPLFAHMVSMSTGDLRVDGSRAEYELRMPSYEVAHVKDPDRTLLEHIRFRAAGADGKRVQQHCSEQQGTYVCTATYDFPAPIDVLEAECTFAQITVPNHVHLLRAYKADKNDQAVFDLSFTTAELRFRPPTALETTVREGSAGFMRAAGGLAPLLFLASLVLAARTRRELLLSTAAFLLAEAVACLVAPRFAAQLSPRFIEAAAALTIAYLAFEIILLPNSGKRWLIIGVLGLFHGTYFSLFLTGSGFHLAPFLSGVVTAELLLIAVFAFVLSGLARLPRAVPVAASAMLTIGVIWFVMRLRS